MPPTSFFSPDALMALQADPERRRRLLAGLGFGSMAPSASIEPMGEPAVAPPGLADLAPTEPGRGPLGMNPGNFDSPRMRPHPGRDLADGADRRPMLRQDIGRLGPPGRMRPRPGADMFTGAGGEGDRMMPPARQKPRPRGTKAAVPKRIGGGPAKVPREGAITGPRKYVDGYPGKRPRRPRYGPARRRGTKFGGRRRRGEGY